jgi:hypothetical protein
MSARDFRTGVSRYAQSRTSPLLRFSQQKSGHENGPILTYAKGGMQRILLHFSDSRNKCCFVAATNRAYRWK